MREELDNNSISPTFFCHEKQTPRKGPESALFLFSNGPNNLSQPPAHTTRTQNPLGVSVVHKWLQNRALHLQTQHLKYWKPIWTY